MKETIAIRVLNLFVDGSSGLLLVAWLECIPPFLDGLQLTGLVVLLLLARIQRSLTGIERQNHMGQMG